MAVLRLNPSGTAALYATYLGGAGDERSPDIAIDAEGNAYVTGATDSMDFPASPVAVYSGPMGFAAKLNPTGTALVYSIIVPGTTPTRIAVQGGEAYVAGHAYATFMPTADPFNPFYSGDGSRFLAKMNSSGTVIAYGTFLGKFVGNIDVQVDSSGSAYVAGAVDTPMQPVDGFQPHMATGTDLYVVKFNATGSRIVGASYLGGRFDESLGGLALHPGGSLYVAGRTTSPDLPVTNGAYSTSSKGAAEVFVAKIDGTAISCAYTVAPLTAAFPAAGGTGTLSVTASSGCAWSAAAYRPGEWFSWIGVRPGSTGIGSGTVTFEVEPSWQTTPRTGSIAVAGQTVAITQAAASCTFTLMPQRLSFYGQGGSSTIFVMAPYGCMSTAVSNASWITITQGQTVSGPTTVEFTVAPTAGTARTGTITIGGQTVTVSQRVPVCTFSLSSSWPTQGLPREAGVYTVIATASAGCTWEVVSDVPWVTITSGASGTGSGPVVFTVAANTGGIRTGWLIAGEARLVITQGKSPLLEDGCQFTIRAPSTVVPNAGIAGTATLTASQPECAWTVASDVPWLQVAPLSGSGSATIHYTAFPNFTSQSRFASITVPGQRLLISQEPFWGAPEVRFLGQIYFNFFGRNASTSEIGFHIASGKTRAELVSAFFGSEEFNLGGRFVAGLYVGLLDRDAEFGGWLFQRNALATNQVNPFSLVQNFLGSQEFQLKTGTLSNAEFVTLLYRQVLLREPTQPEVLFQSGALASGTTRTQLATAFLNSAEFRIGTGPRLSAFLVYALLLQRDATPAEFNLRVAQLQNGMPIRTIITEILGSSEFGAMLQ